MGSTGTPNRNNGTWRSTTNGTTWSLVNGNCPWSKRNAHSSVVTPDGSIVLMGGSDHQSSGYKNDVWLSDDKGVTWTLMGQGPANSPDQNPLHTYTKPGIYTVSMKATNAYGSNREVKVGYIEVGEPVPPQTEYFVYAEAGEPGEIYTIAKGFWDQMIIAENGDIEWNDWHSESDIISATDARESHWNSTTNADDWIENADFAYFSGHGNQNLIAFQNYDEGSGLNYTHANSMRLGSGRLKWAVLDSCESLNYTSWTNWLQSFTGLHMLLGMNTSTVPSFDTDVRGRGEVFALLMRGDYVKNSSTPLKIIDAWDWAGKYTWSTEPGHSSYDVFTGVVYDTYCLNDYLPGWESSCSSTSGSWGYQTTLVFHQTGSEKTGNFKSRTLDPNAGKYTLEASVPDEDTIMVYSSKKPEYTKEWVDRLAKNLGMSGKSSETEFAFFSNNADKDDNFFVVQKDATIISFQKFDARSGFPLSEDESVSVANRFLTENGLMSDQELEPRVIYNSGEILTKSGERKIDWRTAVVTYSRELDGLPVWNSQKMIELDSKGNVIGYFQNWRDYEPYKEVKLKSPENAFAEF